MATAYLFEQLNYPKAHHVNADKRDLLEDRRRPYPNENYLSGNGKSMVWMGFSHYAPRNRRWQTHDAKRALPNKRVAGQIEFTDEDSWRKWQYDRDRPGSKYCISSSYKNIYPLPELKQSGYAFNPHNLYRTGIPALTLYNPHNPWPKTEVRAFPTWRGPRGYYGYYHEELDIHHNGRYRFPRDHKVLTNDEDLLKYEHMNNVPTCHTKLPVEFPVLM